MRTSAEFAQTIRRGARAGRSTLVVHGRAADSDGFRIGFVVSKAVGGAVVRNKVRRRLRGLVMERFDTVPSGIDLVVRALPAAAGASYLDLAGDLDSALATVSRRVGAP
jgi:ribonuclease P protein component